MRYCPRVVFENKRSVYNLFTSVGFQLVQSKLKNRLWYCTLEGWYVLPKQQQHQAMLFRCEDERWGSACISLWLRVTVCVQWSMKTQTSRPPISFFFFYCAMKCVPNKAIPIKCNALVLIGAPRHTYLHGLRITSWCRNLGVSLPWWVFASLPQKCEIIRYKSRRSGHAFVA